MVSPLNIATTWGRSIMAKPGRRMCCRKIGSCGKRSRLRKILTVKMSRTAESCFFFYVFRKIDYRLVKDNYWLLLIVSWGWDEFWCFFLFFFVNGFGNSVIMVSLYVWWIEDHWLWMGKGWSSIHKLLFVFGDLWWVEEDMLIFFCDFVG
jgi:hypothetical protein